MIVIARRLGVLVTAAVANSVVIGSNSNSNSIVIVVTLPITTRADWLTDNF